MFITESPRFDEPTSIEEARDRLSTLTQRVAELQERIGVINQAKPPAYERTTHAQWQESRQRTIAVWKNVSNEQRYVKQWLTSKLDDLKVDRSVSLAEHLFDIAEHVKRLESLYALVRRMIEDEGSDETYRDVVAHYEAMDKRWPMSER